MAVVGCRICRMKSAWREMNDIQCGTEKRPHLNERASWKRSASENDLAKWAGFSWMGLELKVGDNKACGVQRAGGVA